MIPFPAAALALGNHGREAPDAPEPAAPRGAVAAPLNREQRRAMEAQARQRGVGPGTRATMVVSAQPSLGEKLLANGEFEQALQCILADHKRDPQNAGHMSNIGIAYQAQGYPDVAVTWFERALAADPKHSNSWSCMGASLEQLGKVDEAIDAFFEAVRLAPEHADALSNLAITLKERRRFDEAYEVCERGLKLRPHNQTNHSNMIFTMEMDPRVSAAQAQQARRRWYNKQRLDWQFRVWPNEPDPERKINIAYLSSDFRRHSALYSFAPLLFEYDKSRFHVTCIHACPVRDEVTGWITGAVDRFVERIGMNNGEEFPLSRVDDNSLVRVVRDLNIDILVDLSGHTSGHRLAVLTAKPAPVQCSSVGSMTGTGIPDVDWFLADREMVPEAIRPHFAEKIWDLPSAFTYASPDYTPDVEPAPHLANGYITFGCLNRYSKVSVETIAAWREILLGAPTARLYLKDKVFSEESGRERIYAELAGVERERIILAPSTAHIDHLRAHANVDICLDPWPQGGGTSTLEALWMGCQVVTYAGERPSSRTSASIGVHVSGDVHVTDSAEAYIAKAIELAATGHAMIAERRGTLRDRMRETPLADTKAWVGAVEAAYREMWRLWCAAQKAEAAA